MAAKGDSWADSWRDVPIESFVELLNFNQLNQAEIFEDYLDGGAPAKVSFVLEIVGWQGQTIILVDTNIIDTTVVVFVVFDVDH